MVSTLVIVALLSFEAGKWGTPEKDHAAIQMMRMESLSQSALVQKPPSPKPQTAAPKEEKEGSGTYVASKNGTKYYLPSCSGANRIKEENKVWFATKEEAVAAGYEPAAQCPGL